MFARTVLYAKMVGAKKAIDDYKADTKPAPAKKAAPVKNAVTKKPAPTKKTAQRVKKLIVKKRDIFNGQKADELDRQSSSFGNRRV